MNVKPRASGVSVALALLTLAGCGSTVRVDAGTGSAADALDGIAAPVDGSSTTPGADEPAASASPTSTTTATGVGTSAPSDASSSTPTTSPTGGSSAAGGAAGPATGKGFTATTVRIGYGVCEDCAGAAAALGVAAASTGDQEAQLKAMVSSLNKRGGLLGRQIQLVRAGISSNNGDEVNGQKACTTWTQDNKVAAVVIPQVAGATLYECLAKAGTPLITDRSAHLSDTTLTRYANTLLQPGGMSTDRFLRLMLDSLVDRGFFSKWDARAGAAGTAPLKVGVLYNEEQDEAYQGKLLIQLLKAQGYPVAETVTYANSATGIAAASHSAVLRFRQAGVTHVFGAGLLFWQDAETQGYRPRNAIRDIDVNVPSNASPRQLAGAMGVSYTPAGDVSESNYPGDPTPATKRCREVMTSAGLKIRSNPELYSMEVVCDQMTLLSDAFSRSRSLTAAGLLAGVNALGAWQSAQTWVSRFGPGQHASTLAVRDLSYRSSCSCFNYDSKNNRTG